MYVCGLTVYDYAHLGHARMLIVFDVIARHLRASGYRLRYVRNITDIDDKIIKRAAETGESVRELTDRFIRVTHEDCEALGIEPPDDEPRATEHLESIITMIEALLDRGFAYRADNGDIYYAVERFEDYGKLSGKRVEELRAGARVEVEEAKRDPVDFALWKAAKPGEPAWDSPWGPGRPGWHIECSAMSTALLGNHFDIHGGGMDLQFPHHENEIAQSCGATGEPFVNVWLHNGFVRVDEEKMSKSLGNFFTVREVLAKFHPEVVRYLILASHYRKPLNYSDDQLRQAKAALDRLYTSLRGLPEAQAPEVTDYDKQFRAAMDDDFNTPEALAVIQMLARDINTAKGTLDDDRAIELAAVARRLGDVLGILEHDPELYFKTTPGSAETTALSDERIEELIAKRNAARAAKSWKEADRYRDELQAEGVVLEDGPDGTTWRRE